MGMTCGSIDGLIGGIKDIAGQQTNAFNFISDLRKHIILEDTNLVRSTMDAEPTQFAFIYILDTLLSDIWTNISTDASFEYPWDDPDIETMSEKLRSAILLVADDKENLEAIMKNICQAIYHYYICLNRIELQLLEEGPKVKEVGK